MSNSFGSALRERRQQAGLSQQQLASRVGLDVSYISKVENGRMGSPAADTIVEICHTLDIEPEPLLGLTGKLPSRVHEFAGSSTAAQQFMRAAHELLLTETEWQTMLALLQTFRETQHRPVE